MTKVVNDDYPTPGRLTDDEIKAKFLAESHTMTTTTNEGSHPSTVPTEAIELPSKGFFYPEGHPLSSGVIEMRYMTAKEEDILSSQNLIKQGIVIDKLLQSLIVTKVNYNDILTIDKNAIFVAARILAYGKEYEAEMTCASCEQKSKLTIDLSNFETKEIDWSKFTKGQVTHKYILPVSKGELTLKFLTHGDERKIDDMIKASKKLSKITGVNSELTTRLKHVIHSVNGNEDRAFINNYVDNMLSRDSLALRTYLKEVTPDVDTTFEFTCPHCGHEVEKMALPIGVGFFWPGA